MEDYRLKNKIEGSTSTNDSVEDIEQALLKHKADTEAKEAKKRLVRLQRAKTFRKRKTVSSKMGNLSNN